MCTLVRIEVCFVVNSYGFGQRQCVYANEVFLSVLVQAWGQRRQRQQTFLAETWRHGRSAHAGRRRRPRLGTHWCLTLSAGLGYTQRLRMVVDSFWTIRQFQRGDPQDFIQFSWKLLDGDLGSVKWQEPCSFYRNSPYVKEQEFVTCSNFTEI